MIRLIIESRIKNVPLIGGAVRGIVEMLSIGTADSYHLELCVVEAVTNVVKHAYHFEAGHSVEVEIQVCLDRLIFNIHDSGERITLEKIAPLQFDSAKVETLPERGMGVHILKNLMDEIDYKVIDGRNVLTMIKYLKDADTPG